MRSAVLIGGVLLAACGPPPAPPAAPLESDDFALGGIPADADTAEVRLSFGDPIAVMQSANPFADTVPLTTWQYDGYEVRFSGSVPTGFLIEARGEETARGLRVGDAAEELLRRYGEPDTRAGYGWTYLEPAPLDYLRIIDFLVEQDTIRRIYIGRSS